MRMAKLSTPIAILIGSAIISAGLYFGIQNLPLQSSVEVAATSGTPESALINAMPARASDDQIRPQVIRQLKGHHETILELCWPREVSRETTDSSERYQLDLTFDGQTGQQLARGIQQYRANRWPQVASCLERSLPAITIDPTGKNARIQVTLMLP